MRFCGENLEAVNVRFRSPVLRVLLRPVLPYVLVTTVAHKGDDHDHAAEHRAVTLQRERELVERSGAQVRENADEAYI